MMINTDNLISMTDANQNFSRVVKQVDKDGMVVILKNNKPRYIIVDFDEYDAVSTSLEMRKQKINTAADKIIDENLEAFLELAK